MDLIKKKRKKRKFIDNNNQIDNEMGNDNEIDNQTNSSIPNLDFYLSRFYSKSSIRLATFISLYFTLIRLFEHYGKLNFIPSSIISSIMTIPILNSDKKMTQELSKRLLVISACSTIKYSFPKAHSESWLFSIFTAQIVRSFAIEPECLDYDLDKFWKRVLQIDPKGFNSVQLMAQGRLKKKQQIHSPPFINENINSTINSNYTSAFDNLTIITDPTISKENELNQIEKSNELNQYENKSEKSNELNQYESNGIIPCSLLHPQINHIQAILLTMKEAAIASIPIYTFLQLISFLIKWKNFGIIKRKNLMTKTLETDINFTFEISDKSGGWNNDFSFNYLQKLNHHLISISKSTIWISILSGLVMTQLCLSRKLKLAQDDSNGGLVFWIIGFIASILSMPFCPIGKRMTLAIFVSIYFSIFFNLSIYFEFLFYSICLLISILFVFSIFYFIHFSLIFIVWQSCNSLSFKREI